MRSAPVPNIPPIPGMCPSIAVAGGGGDGGGGSGGDGGDGEGNGPGNGEGSGEDASGDGRDGGCSEGDPVCPITGKVFIPIYDFGFHGPLPLRWVRTYASRGSKYASEIGYGWAHSYSWRIEVRRRDVVVLDDQARAQIFPKPAVGETKRNGLGWRLLATPEGFELRPDRERVLHFKAVGDGDMNHLTALADRNGNAIRLERDERGILRKIVDSAGRPYRVDCDDRGRITRIAVATDPSGATFMDVVRYAYDEAGDLCLVTDAANYTEGYRYDNHLVVEHRSWSGLTYTYRYDGRTPDAYCVESWGEYPGKIDPALKDPPPVRPDGPDHRARKGLHHRRFTYSKADRYGEAENSLGGLTRYFGDEKGRATKIIDATGGVTVRQFAKDSSRQVGASDPRGSERLIERDDGGAATYFADAGQKGIARIRRGDGTEITYNEQNGAVVERSFDDRGNLTIVRHPDGTVEEHQYDARGLPTVYVDRMGATTRIQHDAMGNCVRIDRPDGGVEVSQYDYLGRRIAHIDGANLKTEWAYDERSEIVWKRHADGSEIRITYDALRKPLAFDDAGRITRYTYGGLGWLIKVERPSGAATEMRYDTEGNLVEVKNGRGQVFTIVRDMAGRCREWTSFEGVRTTQSYDRDGKIRGLKTPLGNVVIERNKLGEVAKVELVDCEVAFEYSPDGVARIDNAVVPVTQDVDPMGRVVATKQGSIEAKLAWAGGALTAVAASKGLPVTYDYALSGRLERIHTGSVSVRVDRDEGPDYLDYLGTGLVRRRKYGPTGRLVSQTLAKSRIGLELRDVATKHDPGFLFHQEFEFDLGQNLRKETRSDQTTVIYQVDADAQVTEKAVYRGTKLESTERIGYDAAGSPRIDGVTTDAVGRPVEYRGEKFEYDAAGRLVKRLTDAGMWRYEWNALDQLVRVVAPKHTVEIDYDGKGRRMKKRVKKAGELVKSVSYFWANNVVLHEVDEIAKSTRTYIRDNKSWELVGHVDVVGGEERPCFYMLQPNGAIDFAVDADGKRVWDATRTVFGHYTPTIEEVDVTLRFANQFYDADVELVYNRMRWYDPRVAAYASTDPLVLGGNLGPRDYVPNPLVQMDPTGEFTHPGPGPGTSTTTGGTDNGGYHPSPSNPTTPRPTTITNTGASAQQHSQPGHWAAPAGGRDGSTVPGFANCPPEALDHGSNFGADDGGTSTAQGIVNAAGNTYGCHGCGSRESGWGERDGVQHWTCDHQPPRSAYSETTAATGAAGQAARTASRQPGAVRLYPHCRNCSMAQGQSLSGAISAGGNARRTQAAQQGLALMQQNMGT